jgi:hypothetical protein
MKKASTQSLITRIGKKSTAINRAAYRLEGKAPGESLTVQRLVDDFDDMKEELIERGAWEEACDKHGFDYGVEGFDCTA